MRERRRRELASALRRGRGVIRRDVEPSLSAALDSALRQGQLVALLPGVYASADDGDRFDIRVRALAVWKPDAVLVGAAAAKVTFWPELAVSEIEATSRRDVDRPGFRLRRRRIPLELVLEVDGLRCSTPALAALDLSSAVGGEAIDTVLRTRSATLDELHEALLVTPSRRGNADRRRLLLDSVGRPWSEAERDLHRLLRAAGIVGWEGNQAVEICGLTYWIDIAFRALKLAIEVDGWEFHSGRSAFERDRWRQNDLVLAGWRVLRFTAAMIRDQPELVVRQIEEALALARHATHLKSVQSSRF